MREIIDPQSGVAYIQMTRDEVEAKIPIKSSLRGGHFAWCGCDLISTGGLHEGIPLLLYWKDKPVQVIE